MIHRDNIEGYPGTLSGLAGEVSDLRHDAPAVFLHALAVELDRDGVADAGRDRPRLATALREASKKLAAAAAAAADVEQAWSICAPRMDGKS